MAFGGRSFVADPIPGRVLAQGPQNEEATLVVTCEAERVEKVRRSGFFLIDALTRMRT